MGACALHDYWLLQNLMVIPIQEPSLSQHIAKGRQDHLGPQLIWLKAVWL